MHAVKIRKKKAPRGRAAPSGNVNTGHGSPWSCVELEARGTRRATRHAKTSLTVDAQRGDGASNHTPMGDSIPTVHE